MNHHVESAYAAAICAGFFIDKFNDKENAIKNYRWAVEWMEDALDELDGSDKEDALARIEIWKSKIERLENGTYVR